MQILLSCNTSFKSNPFYAQHNKHGFKAGLYKCNVLKLARHIANVTLLLRHKYNPSKETLTTTCMMSLAHTIRKVHIP